MASSDVLIVGGGLAGLFCALKLAPVRVTVLAAAPLGRSAASAWAQGGVAAAVGEGDSPQAHARDTISAGAGLVDAPVALAVAREAADRIADLAALGAAFDREPDGRLALSREAAHSARRIVRARGDSTGAAIMDVVIAALAATPSISVVDGLTAEELIVERGRARGVWARGADGARDAFYAGAIVLATGGAGHLYKITTNPAAANADAIALAGRAGAVIADAEFVQFHPTALDVGRDPAPLATEALRGEGAVLVNRAGARFALAVDPAAELAPRDVVARAVFAEIAAGRGAFLDATAALGPRFAQRFPTVYALCKSVGLDPAKEWMPVAPAAHYHMGGVATDALGRSSLPGLWAIGEAASTGLHGANRLASNSLLEAVVFGARAAQDIGRHAPRAPADAPAARESSETQSIDPALRERMRAVMSAQVGVIRNGRELEEAICVLARIRADASDVQTANRALASLFIAVGARARAESRGAHFRSDFPNPDPAQAARAFATLADVRRAVAGLGGAATF